jgi:hypothetical protein
VIPKETRNNMRQNMLTTYIFETFFWQCCLEILPSSLVVRMKKFLGLCDNILTSLNNITVYYRGWTLRDFLERLPREWIYEELMETLEDKGVHLSPTM